MTLDSWTTSVIESCSERMWVRQGRGFRVSSHAASLGDPQNLAISVQYGLSGLAMAEASFFHATGCTLHARRATAYLTEAISRVTRSPSHPWHGSLFLGLGSIVWSANFAARHGVPIDPEVVDPIAERALSAPDGGPDLSVGQSGRILLALSQFVSGRGVRWKHFALEQAEGVLESRGEDGLWSLDVGHRPVQYWGMAHGTAGIAYAFLEIYNHTGLRKWRSLSAHYADLLITKAVGIDDNVLQWTHGPINKTVWCSWCHGNCGISLLFNRLSGILPEYKRIVDGCRRGISIAMWANNYNGLCHGISGVGYALSEIDGGNCDDVRLILEARCQYDQFGPLWVGDDFTTPTEELGVSYPGVAMYLATQGTGSGHPYLLELG